MRFAPHFHTVVLLPNGALAKYGQSNNMKREFYEKPGMEIIEVQPKGVLMGSGDDWNEEDG